MGHEARLPYLFACCGFHFPWSMKDPVSFRLACIMRCLLLGVAPHPGLRTNRFMWGGFSRDSSQSLVRVGGFLGPPSSVLGIWDASFDLRLLGRAVPVGSRIIFVFRLLGRASPVGSRIHLLFGFSGGYSPLGVELFVLDLTGVYFVALWIVLFSLLFPRFLSWDF